MSDRFSGTVHLGGPVTCEQLAKCVELTDDNLEFGEFDYGSAHFIECMDDNFHDLVVYCKAQNIPLSIQWGAELGFDALVQFWINGHSSEYYTTHDGEIIAKLADLRDHEDMTVGEYIKTLGIPEFPAFSLVG